MIEYRTKCPALIHECRTHNIFYWTMSDVRLLLRYLPKSWAPIHKKSLIVLNSTFHIKWSLLMSNPSDDQFILVLVYLRASQGNWAQIPQVIQSVKFYSSHQMKPYSRVRAIWGSSYTCFSIFGELGQVGEIVHKYSKSWELIHRKSFIVLNSTFHIKWSPT